jgi:hypothetical protein
MNIDKTNDPVTEEAAPRRGLRRVAFVIVAAAILVSFLAAYGFAASRPSDAASACDEGFVVAGADGECASGCCSSGEAGPLISGEASVSGDVQRVSVDVSKGYFDPGEIVLTAGVPTEITFSEGRGCMAEVMFEQFGILEDLTSGGAVITLPALDPGTYEFSCGMRMVFGTLVVR